VVLSSEPLPTPRSSVYAPRSSATRTLLERDCESNNPTEDESTTSQTPVGKNDSDERRQYSKEKNTGYERRNRPPRNISSRYSLVNGVTVERGTLGSDRKGNGDDVHNKGNSPVSGRLD